MKTQVAVTKTSSETKCVMTNIAGQQLTVQGVTNADLWFGLATLGVTDEVAEEVARQLTQACSDLQARKGDVQ